jgi:hypothetical protein
MHVRLLMLMLMLGPYSHIALSGVRDLIDDPAPPHRQKVKSSLGEWHVAAEDPRNRRRRRFRPFEQY